jgi:ubiquinone/menaquinone biosynthesis C-methylase UbiE
MRGTPSFLILLALAFLSSACSGFSKIDYSSLTQRAAWQRPELVIAALDIQPGDHVVDLGSGEGYFLPYLAEAVGPDGRVSAVEVDPEVVDALKIRVDEAGWENVRVLLGDFDDPGLADAGVDLVFVVNTYHHIEDRPVYFGNLQADLGDGGRVAVIDPNLELTGLLSLALDEGHKTAINELHDEMRQAGYREIDRFDFLPVQVFAVYVPLPANE